MDIQRAHKLIKGNRTAKQMARAEAYQRAKATVMETFTLLGVSFGEAVDTTSGQLWADRPMRCRPC